MYDPVSIPPRLTRRRVRRALVVTVVVLIAIAVTVVRTMPHPPPADPLSLDQLGMMMNPDAAETELIAAMVRARLGQQLATPGAAAAAAATPPVCAPASTQHTWDSTQHENATTIVQVGMVLGFPERGEIVALATAMQESQLYNLGDLGVNNDHDSLGLFQQRPSMGWGTPEQVTDPIYAATAFYLALQRISGWESMAVTVAAQSVQRSAYPDAYAKWEPDATALAQEIRCSVL